MTYQKDNNLYFFNSKFKELNNLYSISYQTKKDNIKKIKNQKDYLKSTFLEIDGGKKYISLYDCSYGANIKSSEYHAEIWHRVKTLQDYAHEKGYSEPFFLTITPPSYLKPLKQVRIGKNKKGQNLIKLVDNPQFCGDPDFVNKARQYISEIWQSFLRQRIFQEMKKKYGERLIYMRTYEPFLDGTPHAHIVCFIPPEYKDRFYDLAINYFSKTKFDIKDVFENKEHVIAYILKYILKSFNNAKIDKIDDIAHWYIHYKIRRFTTSRTLVPLKIFRLLGYKEEFRDLGYVNRLYKDDYLNLTIGFNPYKLYSQQYTDFKGKDFYIAQIDITRGDGFTFSLEVVYEKSLNIVRFEKDFFDKSSIPKKIIPSSEIIKFHEVKIDKKHSIFLNCSLDNLKKKKIIPIYYKNSLKTINVDGKNIKVKVPFAKMLDFELLKYYDNLNIYDVNIHHYLAVRNECIKRGLIFGKISPLHDENQAFSFLDDILELET